MTYDIDGDDEQSEPELASPETDDDDDFGCDGDIPPWSPNFTLHAEEMAERKWHPQYCAALERLIDQARRECWPTEKIKTHVLAMRKLMRTCVGDGQRHESELNDPAPKPSTGFAVQQTKRRLSKSDITQRKRLLGIANRIKSDDSATGTLLHEAKRLLGHGKFEDWLRTIPMKPRTARRRMAA